jgi:polar amino acid transport system permease protein
MAAGAATAAMDYVFQFGSVFASFDMLLRGARLTAELSVATMLAGLVIGVAGALAKSFGPAPLRIAVSIYVEAIRNTPFLVQLFLIFFGLPSIGIRLDPVAAALIGMSVNCGAYSIEIVRSGIMAIPRGQIEAARALAFRTLDIVRHVVLFPALRTAFPALGSQFILVMLGSSVVSTISAEELTAVGHILETQTFRPFEVYLVITAMYVGLALALKAVFGLVTTTYFSRRGSL